MKKVAAVGGGLLVLVVLGTLLAQNNSLFLFQFFPPLAGGVFAGWVMKNRGWLWGLAVALLGLGCALAILKFISLPFRDTSHLFIPPWVIFLFLIFGIAGGILGEGLKNILRRR